MEIIDINYIIKLLYKIIQQQNNFIGPALISFTHFFFIFLFFCNCVFVLSVVN
jgi:hypothetical protein